MPDGACILDGIQFKVWHDPQQGWGWKPNANSYLPYRILYGSAGVGRAEPAHHRVLDWRDWSAGQGASKITGENDPNNRLHYSEGPSGASPGRLVQGHEVRTVALTAGTTQVNDFFEIAGRLYVVNGASARRITPTLNAETIATRRADGVVNASTDGVYVFGMVFTQASPLWYDSASTKVFLGTSGGATQWIVSFDGTAAAQDDDVLQGYWALSQAVDGQRLWASASPADTSGPWVRNTLQGTNPFTIGAWSATFPLNNREASITGLAALRDGIIATATDGMIYRFDYATGLPTPLTDSRSVTPSATAGRQMNVWNGVLVVPTSRGLAWYAEQSDSPGRFEAIGPSHLHGHEMPVRDSCTALFGGDPEWLYASFYDGTNSWVWRGRRPLAGEQVAARVIWDALAVIPTARVTALRVTLLGTNPVLCIGTDVPDVRFLTLPQIGLNWVGANADQNCRSSGTTVQQCYLPDQDSGAPGVPITAWRLRAKCLGFSSGETVDVFARIDRGSWVQVGTLAASPFSSIAFDPPLQGGSVGLRLQWNGAVNTTFKQIEYLLLDCVEDAEPSYTVDAVLHLGQRQTVLGEEEPYGVTERLQFLYDRLGRPGTFTITDPFGTQFTAKLDPVAGIHPELIEINPEAEPETLVKLRLNLYDNLTGHRGFVWDGADTWDELVNPPYWDGAV